MVHHMANEALNVGVLRSNHRQDDFKGLLVLASL